MRRIGALIAVLLSLLPFAIPDSVDDIRARADAVAQRATQRCSAVPNNEKVLPRNAISDLPLPFDPQGPIPEFRASMYEAQKIAVNRAIFFSYIMQQAELDDEPDMGYYFYSTLSTLSSSDERIMGSKIVFSKDMMMSSWYGGVNQTLPFFGPYAFKRFNTSQMLFAIDLGSDPSFAYTDEMKHITPNPWYAAWLSDRTAVELPQPALLELKVLKDNSGVETINFFGPPVELPAIWTMPFFDCLFTDKWQLSVTAPVADLERATRLLTKRQAGPGPQARQTQPSVPGGNGGNAVNVQQGAPVSNQIVQQQLPTIANYIAAVSVEMDYKKIDINQCDGDQQFNAFAGTHKCKRETTVCEALHGHGLRRGGYQCVCRAGFKYPPGRSGPFSGGEVESASSGDYAKADAFQCLPIQDQEVLISPAALAQSAVSNTINAVPQAPPQRPPPPRPVNFQQPPPPPSQVALLQADTVPNQPLPPFLPFSPDTNTPKPLTTILTRPTPPMQSLPPQTNSPFRNPGFAPSQPQPVPNAAGFFPNGQSPQPVPQFMPQPINVSTRTGPPNFAAAQSEQFFLPHQFQLPDNLGPPQQLSDPAANDPQRPQIPAFAQAARPEARFAVPQFISSMDSPSPQFNQAGPVRRTRQAGNEPLPTDNLSVPPQNAQNAAIIQQLIQKLSQENNLMFRARQMLDNLSPRNCSANRFAEKVDLGFSQEFGRKIAKQFATQARSALRLSHFLSNYLQNGIAVEGKRRNKLTENMILGEMAAMIIAEPAIGAVSIQFEDSIFPGRRFFAPTALYNKMLDELQFYHYPDNYTNFDWYRDVKSKTANLRLMDFAVDIKMRVDAAGSRFTDVPTQSFKAITFDDMKTPFGPYYDCFYLDKFFWFEVPFFAKRADGGVQFGGLISVGINPDQIDVNQCSSAEEPLFRGTDRCDRQTTTCVPVSGRGFRAGGYKCVCKEGFEYPYLDSIQYFDGLAVEIEYQNKLLDFPNNYANLRCRRPGQKLNAIPDPGAMLPLVPTQPARPPTQPSTAAPVRTVQTTKVTEQTLAADNNPWIPSVPITPIASTVAMPPPTTTTPSTPFVPPNPFVPTVHNFVPPNSFAPPRPPNNFSPSTNFVPGLDPSKSLAPKQPNTFTAPFQPPPRPVLPQGDGSFAVPDRLPEFMSTPGVDTNPPDFHSPLSGNFLPDTSPVMITTTPTTTTTMTTTTTTTTTTTPSTTTTTTTTTTPSTTTTSTTSTTSERTTETTEQYVPTTATLEDLGEELASSSVEVESTLTTATETTRAVTKHGPTKYTVKVIKGTTGPTMDAEASNEVKVGKRIQGKPRSSAERGSISMLATTVCLLVSVFYYTVVIRT
ncbi:uncharacterized protein LOC129581073 [Paramacrobiotus metropolitanus]|uniref:uncharacterized protein LOC129581073 n=1 Tax=Paramacrobiotus metropolitanus TaxID=2943436 RepID=UPI0024461BF9|nr:uncharacterized protein LOC129581073 [Paramacrobiotus metropolitanus]